MSTPRVVIQSPYSKYWNGETGVIIETRQRGCDSRGVPHEIAVVKLDAIATCAEFSLDELVDL